MTGHEQANRSYWESRIMDAARRVMHLGTPATWLASQEFDEYLMAWAKLQTYYERTEDEVVGPEVISFLVIFTDNLYHTACDPDRNPQERMLADQRLDELLTVVQGAMGEAYNNFYHRTHGHPDSQPNVGE